MVTKPKYGSTKEDHRIYMTWWREANRNSYNKGRLEWAENNRNKRTAQARNSHLKKKFNISLKEFNRLVESQFGKCAICGCNVMEILKDRRGRMVPQAYVDHDHKTKKIRGILCMSCNTALGHFKDNPKLLRKAIGYLNA